MNIVDAVRRALADGKAIARPWGERRILIKPTNGPECCLIQLEESEKPPCQRWNPKADDLTAEDWEITE